MRLLLTSSLLLVVACDQSTGLRTGNEAASGSTEVVQSENGHGTADDVANKNGSAPVSITGTMLTMKLSRECIGNCSTVRLKAILSKSNVALTDVRWQSYTPPLVLCLRTSDPLVNDCTAPNSAPINQLEIGAKLTAKADGKEISATVGNVPGLKLIVFRTSNSHNGLDLLSDPDSACHDPSWITSMLGSNHVTSFTWADSQPQTLVERITTMFSTNLIEYKHVPSASILDQITTKVPLYAAFKSGTSDVSMHLYSDVDEIFGVTRPLHNVHTESGWVSPIPNEEGNPFTGFPMYFGVLNPSCPTLTQTGDPTTALVQWGGSGCNFRDSAACIGVSPADGKL